jgi:hypothetical protein
VLGSSDGRHESPLCPRSYLPRCRGGGSDDRGGDSRVWVGNAAVAAAIHLRAPVATYLGAKEG